MTELKMIKNYAGYALPNIKQMRYSNVRGQRFARSLSPSSSMSTTFINDAMLTFGWFAVSFGNFSK